MLFLHFILFLIVFALPNTVLLLPFYFIIQIFFLAKKNYNSFLIGGIYSVCLKSELIYYVYGIIVLGAIFVLAKSHLTLPFKKARNYFSLFVCYLIIIYISQLFYNYSILSLPMFSVTFLLPIATFFFVGLLPAKNIDLSYILNNLLCIAISQATIALFLQAVPFGVSKILARPTLGDGVIGTTHGATSLAFLLLVSILPFLLNIFHKSYKIREKRNIALLAIMFIGILFLNDSKTTLYAVLLVFLVWYLLNHYFFGRNIVVRFIFLLSIALVTILSLKMIKIVANNISVVYSDYMYGGRYDAKSRFYEYAFSLQTRPYYQYLLGTGPGTNGTRAANALAYDVMYKKENTVKLPGFIPPTSSSFTKRYLANLYGQDYADTSGYRSALLSAPFNSICAIFIEFGIVGLFLFALFLYSLTYQNLTYGHPFLAKSAFFLLLVNLLISFLSQVFETPTQMHLMYLLLGLSLKSIISKNHKYDKI